MSNFPISLIELYARPIYEGFAGSTPKSRSKYDVVTTHRESDNKCVVRIEGFYNDVFWAEISLVQKWWHLKTPREKILDAQAKARVVAEKLKRRDEEAKFEFDSTIR